MRGRWAKAYHIFAAHLSVEMLYLGLLISLNYSQASNSDHIDKNLLGFTKVTTFCSFVSNYKRFQT